MSTKSHVTMERRVCVVCGLPFDTGNLLLDRRLRPSFESHTVTGWGMCPKDKKLADEGYIALIECNPDRSPRSAEGRTAPEEAYRTGRLAHVACEVFLEMFDAQLEPGQKVVLTEPGVIARLEEMAEREEGSGAA